MREKKIPINSSGRKLLFPGKSDLFGKMWHRPRLRSTAIDRLSFAAASSIRVEGRGYSIKQGENKNDDPDSWEVVSYTHWRNLQRTIWTVCISHFIARCLQVAVCVSCRTKINLISLFFLCTPNCSSIVIIIWPNFYFINVLKINTSHITCRCLHFIVYRMKQKHYLIVYLKL